MEKLITEHKKRIAARVVELDPGKKLVALAPTVTFGGGTVSYNKDSGIVLHENISRLTDEEYIRAYLVVRLVKQLKYPPDALELEKVYRVPWQTR